MAEARAKTSAMNFEGGTGREEEGEEEEEGEVEVERARRSIEVNDDDDDGIELVAAAAAAAAPRAQRHGASVSMARRRVAANLESAERILIPEIKNQKRAREDGALST